MHPDTLTSRNNLAFAYLAAGRPGDATPLFVQNLAERVRVLGPEHPDSLAARSNVAYAYELAGRLSGDAIPAPEQRPEWWKLPEQCENGHEWGPGLVDVYRIPCECQPAQATHTHLTLICQAPGCRSHWHGIHVAA